jgi:hypothetical protein
MVVRIRIAVGPRLNPNRSAEARLALAVSSLLTPAAVLSWVVALWRVLADAKVTEQFAIERGIFSHWQVWLAFGILLQTLSTMLDRHGRRLEGQSS